jgi:FtsP/CotA-like multicopper oxidase with cupredoxin domain
VVAHIRQQPRRSVTFLTAAVFFAAALLVAIGSSGPALATSGGSPYEVPLVVDTNPAPDIVETTIVAQEADVDIGNGVTAHAQTFNGTIPGPEFRLNVGDTVIVHFRNELHHPTGIHWHGIELANASDGTPLTQNQVPQHETFLYKFQVTRPGVYWYHPHHHASTNQVFKGLYGSIIVTDPWEDELQAEGVLPPAPQTRTLALSDITVCKAPGSNDTATYDPAVAWPWAGSGAFPGQPGPTPFDLCEGAPMDEDGNPLGGDFAAGDIPNIQPGGTVPPLAAVVTSARVNEGQTVLTNGKNVGGRAGSPEVPGALAAGASTLDIQAGQGLRLQLGNTATTRFFRLRMTDNAGTQIPLVRVGGQGGLLDHAVVEGGMPGGFDTKYGSGEIVIEPGDRADVVAAIPTTATGPITLWTLDMSRTGQQFAKVPTVPVMHLNVTGTASSPYTIGNGTPLRAHASLPAGAEQEELGVATDVLLDPVADFAPDKLGMANQNIRLTNVGGSTNINDIKGDHDFPGDYTAAPHIASTRYAELGQTLELTVTNATLAHHPFHLHGFSIQPKEYVDADPAADPVLPSYVFPYNEFRDNIDVPPGYTLRFRVRLDDRPLMDGTTPGGGVGRWVFHCHIFFHATFGMISEFVVSDPDGNERPYVNADDTLEEVDEGQTATMTGTYMDPDGDAVTLTGPSVGNFTDNGDGTWSWSYPNAAGPSGLLYVTATDDEGNSDQAVFELIVNGIPPTLSGLTSDAPKPEGGTVTVTGTATDPGVDPLTATIDWGDGSPVEPIGGTFDPGPSATLELSGSHTYLDDDADDIYNATICASDGTNETCEPLDIEIFNVAPTLDPITAPTVAQMGTDLTAGADFEDPGVLDIHTAEWDWGDGTIEPGTVTQGAGFGSVADSHTYTAADLYQIGLTVSDDDGGSDSALTDFIAIFDPLRALAVNAKINSPAGAYVSNPAKIGPAYSTSGARYKSGMLIPSGGTTFQFSAVPFYFNASTYEWYVGTTDKRGYLQGTGSVNGVPGYSFLLSVVDGTPDTYRLKVWNTASSVVVYDNQAPDPIDEAATQALAAGSIVLY